MADGTIHPFPTRPRVGHPQAPAGTYFDPQPREVRDPRFALTPRGRALANQVFGNPPADEPRLIYWRTLWWSEAQAHDLLKLFTRERAWGPFDSLSAAMGGLPDPQPSPEAA